MEDIQFSVKTLRNLQMVQVQERGISFEFLGQTDLGGKIGSTTSLDGQIGYLLQKFWTVLTNKDKKNTNTYIRLHDLGKR